MSLDQYRILVVDDEESLREVLTIMLHREGYQVESAADGAQAAERLKETSYDLIISDIKMPKISGLELLSLVKSQYPETLMLMITAFSSTEEAVEAMRQGAYDYITKPFQNDEIRLIVHNALEKSQLQRENQKLKKALGQQYAFGSLIGKSKQMQDLFSLIERVAASKTNVLITGESGTGKELVAKAVHYNSPRKQKPFVAVNCGAIPENLLESELFGHEKGAFTGATQQKIGLFEVADGGTLFLDEIGELPASMQVKLLRVLQEQELRRVGGTRNVSVDARLVAATNKNLVEEVSNGSFREDLFYRLNVIHLDIPPLRDRRVDIPLLVDHFLAKFKCRSWISEQAMKCFIDYRWPGNVRELENVIERCAVLAGGDCIGLDSLPREMSSCNQTVTAAVVELTPDGIDLDEYLGSIERDMLMQALSLSNGIRKRAAALLGISFRSIRYRLAKFDLASDEDEL